MVKLSCQEHLVPGDTFRGKLEWLERNGFDGIEIWGFDIDERITEMQAALAASTIRLSAMCAGYEGALWSDSDEELDTAISGIDKLLAVCAALGSPGLIVIPAFGSSRPPGVRQPHAPMSQADIQRFGKTLGTVGRLAAGYGVKVFVEPINRYECQVFNTLPEIAAACRVSGEASLMLLPDTFHMNIEEADPCAVLSQHATRIGHVHFCDSNRRPPGQGHIPFGDICRTLDQIGYSGYASLECFSNGEADLQACVRYLRGLP